MKKQSFISLLILLLLIPFFNTLVGQDFNEEKLYQIVSPAGFALDNKLNKDNGSYLFLSKKQNGNKGQLWKILKQKNGFYAIENPYVKKNIDGELSPETANALFQRDPSSSSSHQQWSLEVTGMGSYILKQRDSGMNLSFSGEDSEGKQIYQLPNSPQLWTIVETSVNAPIEKIVRGKNEWENELIFEVNKEKGHNTYIVYPSIASLKSDKYYEYPWLEPNSPNYESLDGEWKFNWVKQPSERPVNFYKENYDVSTWKNIQVPSTWENQGYGTMMYTNITYPFKKNPPLIQTVPDYTIEKEPNPVGSYRRNFIIPENWDGNEIFLHFDGVYSGMYVWINGHKVGYSEGANNDAEFNITKYVKKGENMIAVEVYKWTDGSYIEDQDMFRFAGIHRRVYLYNTPKTHIRDYFIKSEFVGNDFSNSTFKIEASVRNYDNKKSNPSILEVQLLNPEGKSILNLTEPVSSLNSNEETVINLSSAVQKPLLWTAETPNLYNVMLLLKDNQGKELEAMSTKFGFRKIEIKNKRVYVNNEPIFFKGVNRHDTDPKNGKTVSTDLMEKDVLMMKQHNINTIRTSHYPNSSKIYAMFDYYGLYVMDEADLENHGDRSISEKPSWQGAYIDRIERVIERDKNYPSIIFWSLGNESGSGDNFIEMYKRTKEMDPSRPIHYEGRNEIADIDSHMYPSIDRVRSFDQQDSDKPYFLCEYVHSMGNAMGNLAEYWEYIEDHSQRMIGGCIWDWVDQAHNKQGYPDNQYFYGGDFGEKPTDGDFSCNGLTTPDRRVTAKLIEVKRVYQYIKFKPIDLNTGKIEIENKYDFLNLNEFDFTWQVIKNGEVVESGTLPTINLAPNANTTIQIPSNRSYEGESEYFLNLTAKLNKDTRWEKKGFPVATKQFALTDRPSVPMINTKELTELNISESNDDLVIAGDNFTTSFSKQTGLMTSLQYNRTEYLNNQKGLDLNWYRSVNNDKFTDQIYYTSVDQQPVFMYTLAADKKSISIISDHIILINSEKSVKIPYWVKYTIYSNGSIDVDATFTKNSDASIIRRLGLQMELKEEFDNIKYYGKGPHENYIDRIASADVGLYTTTAQGMEEEHYIRAQSLGNREDIRWVELTNSKNQGLKITAKNHMCFSALHFTDEEIWNAKHDFEIPNIRKPQVYLNLDCIQQGLGNATCGPNPMPEYMIPENQPIDYSFRIQPIP